MKKKLLAVSLAAVAALSLASCGGDEGGSSVQPDDLSKKVDLNFDVQYAGSSTISNAKETYTDIDGKAINQGDLLPMWQYIEEKFNVNITDGSYAQSKDDTEYQMAIGTNGGKSADGKQINVFSNTMTNIVTMAKAGSLVALDDYIEAGMMPNFKKYLEENPTVKAQLTVSYNGENHIYATPYFDGADSIEKMFQFNVPWIELLLDGSTTWSEYANASVDARPDEYNGAGSDAHSGDWSYQPFYGAIDTKVKTVNAAGTGTQDVHVVISAEDNIIAQMNAQPNLTGAQYVEMFRKYIDDVYGDYIGEGKLWSKRSEIFTGASALYNADELVALMRIVSLNTQPLTGQNTQKIVVMAPRGTANNRYVNMLDIASMWGVRGLTSVAETANLWFDNEGKLHTAMSDEDAYTALDNLNALYNEGLLLQNYKEGINGSTGGNVYRDNLLKKGYQFMAYDYSASLSEVDDSYQFKSMTDSTLDRFNPVLPPVAQWHANGESDNSFTRFSEDSRALKNGGWCILSASSADQIARAVTLFDYFFCDEGADLQDFGLNNANYRKAVTTYDSEGNRQEGAGTAKMSDGTVYVVIGDKAKAAIGTYGSWTNFYRQRVGATFPIGHIRQDALDYQVAAPSAQTGLSNINLAISLGAMTICTAAGQDNNPFYRCIPTVIDISSSIKTQIDNDTATLNDLWKQDGGYQNVIIYGWGSSAGGTSTKDSYIQAFSTTDTYLAQYQKVIDAMYNN